jgi:hypothetical protein
MAHISSGYPFIRNGKPTSKHGLHRHQLAGLQHSPRSFPCYTRGRFRQFRISNAKGAVIIRRDTTAGSIQLDFIPIRARDDWMVSQREVRFRRSVLICELDLDIYLTAATSARSSRALVTSKGAAIIHPSIHPRHVSPRTGPHRRSCLVRTIGGPW